MVAPVQGSIGKSSNDSSTQDYLTELTNFYADPENEGVEAEFTAPDGSQFSVDNASYLAKITSNVNSGKLDLPATQESNKSVAPNADTNLDSKTDKKSDNKTESEYEKNKAKGKDEAKSAEDGAKEGTKNAGSAGSQASSAKEGKGEVEGVSTKAEDVSSSSESVINNTAAENDASLKETEASKQKLKESNAAGKKEMAKLDSQTAKINNGFKTAMTKLQNKIAAKKAEESSSSPEEVLEDSENQSGPKMGFEGKLMTTAGTVSGENSTDAAWKTTMQGPMNQAAENFKKTEATLQNVKAAGDKAAETFNKNAEGLDQAGAAKLQGAQQQAVVASGMFAAGGTMATLGIMRLVNGGTKTADGAKDATTGFSLIGNPVTLAAGAGFLAKAGFNFTTAVSNYCGSVQGFITSAGLIYKGGKSLKVGKDLRKGREADLGKATEQRTQGQIARRQAVAATTQANSLTIQATQNLNNMLGSLGNSALPAVTVDNPDQLEAVKQDRYDQIMAHEKEHASVIGGTPVVITDANGIAIGGYVEIDVPSVDEADLEGTMEKAQRVIDAALAPSDPSSQDQNIASQAKSVLERAQSLLEEKVEKAEDKKEEKTEEPKEEAKEPVEEVKDELKK